MAGDEGFEPPISGPEPGALPLGQSPLACNAINNSMDRGREQSFEWSYSYQIIGTYA